MNQKTVSLLFEYNFWATNRILNAAEGLTTEQYTAPVPGLSHGSVRGTLVHMLAAEHVWRQRCFDGVSPTTLLREAEHPTLAALRARWREEEAAVRAGLARLTDEALSVPVAYRTTTGAPMEEVLWRLLAHLVNHGTQHRAEAAVALTAFGHSPGDVDLIVYLRQGSV